MRSAAMQCRNIDHIESMTAADHQVALGGQTTMRSARPRAVRSSSHQKQPPARFIVSLPENLLRTQGSRRSTTVTLFDVPCASGPTSPTSRKEARLLIEAKNPLLSIGDEITHVAAKRSCWSSRIARLPVSGQASSLVSGRKTFPTRHPLSLHLSAHHGASPAQSTCTSISVEAGEAIHAWRDAISIRRDPVSWPATAPVDLGSWPT